MYLVEFMGEDKMDLIILLTIKLLDLYVWLLIIAIVVSWLAAFNVINMRNQWVYKAYMAMNKLVDPPMKFVRRYIPPAGGLDLSPMVLIFGIYIIKNILFRLLFI